MAKKIEVDIAYLRSIGLSQKQISDIIKTSEPDHWTNNLPQDNSCYELLPFMITPQARIFPLNVTINCSGQNNPTHSFFTEEDADFIQNKCRLLMEMSNFSFAVNEIWSPDWNNKDEKKYGIVLQNGQARVSENELFNLYVFGIVTKTRSLALDMLEEFKERVESYFNKPFNSVSATTTVDIGESIGLGFTDGNNTVTQLGIVGTIDNPIGTPETNFSPVFIGSFEPKKEIVSTRKKRKMVNKQDIPLIYSMILQGFSQKEVAEKFDYSQGTISTLKKSFEFEKDKI